MLNLKYDQIFVNIINSINTDTYLVLFSERERVKNYFISPNCNKS